MKEHRAAPPLAAWLATCNLPPSTQIPRDISLLSFSGLHTSTKNNGSKAQTTACETLRLDLELQSSQTATKRQGLMMPCTWWEHILRTDIRLEAHIDSLRIPESYSICSIGAVDIYSTSDFSNSVQLWNQQGSSCIFQVQFLCTDPESLIVQPKTMTFPKVP